MEAFHFYCLGCSHKELQGPTVCPQPSVAGHSLALAQLRAVAGLHRRLHWRNLVEMGWLSLTENVTCPSRPTVCHCRQACTAIISSTSSDIGSDILSMTCANSLLTGTDGPVLPKITTVAVAARDVDTDAPIAPDVISCFLLHRYNVS